MRHPLIVPNDNIEKPLFNRVGAVLAATVFFAVLAVPDGVEKFHSELYKSCIVGEHADLKVVSGSCLCWQLCALANVGDIALDFYRQQ